MIKSATFAAITLSVMCASFQAHAGGWGGSKSITSFSSTKVSANNNMSSGGLLNVSPSIKLGNVNVLSGILNNSPILSGNSTLSGNNTGLGILGSGTGLLNNVTGNLTKGRR